MDPIREGMSGVAVEDIQERLVNLGYSINDAERRNATFGSSTATAVTRFRLDHELSLSSEVDAACWAKLVDESWEFGERTLYLRLPNFHGRDIKILQERLNVLGFSCGQPDGYYGVHTEAAVKQFQENVALLADGMAFSDTFDAIMRLHHVWNGKPATGPHPQIGMSFARAASVLEHAHLAFSAADPISRNVAGRLWNLAQATVTDADIELIDSVDEHTKLSKTVFLLSPSMLPYNTNIPNVEVDDLETLPRRIRTACESSRLAHPLVRLELPIGAEYDGTFSASDAQTLAVMLLDAICEAFSN